MRLGFEFTSAKSKRPIDEADRPTVEPMRPEARGQQRRNPSTDQRRIRSQMKRKTASVEDPEMIFLAVNDPYESSTQCPNCYGVGAIPAQGGEDPSQVDDGYISCPTCQGVGVLEDPTSNSGPRTAVNTGADGAARYQNTPNPAKPAWINDEYDDGEATNAQMGGGEADDNDNPLPTWEERNGGEDLDRMEERQNALIDESMGELGPLWQKTRTAPHAASKEGTTMTDEATLLTAMADPRLSTIERQRVAAQLESIRASRSSQVQAARDLDLTAPIEFAHLSSTPIQSLATDASDWMGEIPDAGIESDDLTHDMAAEGSLWFTSRDEAVIDDDEEFLAQAEGMARRLAGRYGEDAGVAHRAFMDHVARLRSRIAKDEGLNASGKPTPGYEVPPEVQEPIYPQIITGPPADNEPLDEPMWPQTGPGKVAPSMSAFDSDRKNPTANPQRVKVSEIGHAFATLQTRIGKQLPPQARPFVAALSTLGSLNDQVGGVTGQRIAENVISLTADWGGPDGDRLRQLLAWGMEGPDFQDETGRMWPTSVPEPLTPAVPGGPEDASSGPVPAGSPAGAPSVPMPDPADLSPGRPDGYGQDYIDPGGRAWPTAASLQYAAYAQRCASAGLVPQPFEVVAGGLPPWLKKDKDGDEGNASKSDSAQSDDTKSEGNEGGNCSRTTCKHAKGDHADGDGACSKCDCPKYLNTEPVTDSDDDGDSDDSGSKTSVLGSPVTAAFRRRVQASLAH